MKKSEVDHDRLLREAVQSHENYLQGMAELKFRRRAAFKRAVAGRVTRQEIGEAIGRAPRTISHIIYEE